MVKPPAHLWLDVDTDGCDVGSNRVDVDTLREDADTRRRDGDGARGNVDAGKAEVDGRDCTQTLTIFSILKAPSHSMSPMCFLKRLRAS